MIIDFHTHTFPEFLAGKAIHKLENLTYTKAFTDGTTQGLLNAMYVAKVDMSVVLPVATSPKQVEVCNNGAIQLNQGYTGGLSFNQSHVGTERVSKLLSFGAMHPDYVDYKTELRRIKKLGIKGIKLHPDYQETLFDDIKYMRIVEAASELDLITLIHAGLDIGLADPIHATPKRIRNVIREVQPKKLVLGHMGGYPSGNRETQYDEHTTVYELVPSIWGRPYLVCYR